tara:strand:+ start:4625 stop:4795 length:171 start_codon:yes stop_codon:yes gene_type:complete
MKEDREHLNVIPAESGEYHTIKELWMMMPTSDKVNYNQDINVYKHHKLAQVIREEH